MSEKAEHVASPADYLKVLVALMVLLIATVVMTFVDVDGFARAHHLGSGWNTAIALTIAILKSLLIVLFFMHVRYASRLTWVFAAAGFIWLMIMLGLTLTDYLTRTPIQHPGVNAQPIYLTPTPENATSTTPRVGKSPG
jgi:cytochrome c oxidase subunit 4